MMNLHDNIADDPEYHICRMLLQFEQHGAVVIYEAYILEDKGYLSSRLQKIPPFSDPITIYKLSPLAAKNMQKMREDWIKKFVQRRNLPNTEIPDFYSLEGADDYFWAFSRKRLNQERNKGRLGLAIKRTV